MEPLSIVAQYQVEVVRGSTERLAERAIAFTGSIGNSHDPGKVLLIPDPFSRQGYFYEFRSKDIVYAEEQPSVAMPDASAVPMVRLWIRKGATGLRIEPFHVQDTAHRLKEFFK